MLLVKKLSSGYGDRIVLQDISFSLQPGQMMGIIGANGSGKSTLLKTVANLLPRLSGTVKIMGEEIRTFSPKQLAQKMAYLPQDMSIPFDFSVRNIVATGRYPYHGWWHGETNEDEKIIEQALCYMGIEDLAQRSIAVLSGGQCQRVFLARILAQQSPVLLLDEPTAGLDICYQEELLRLCQGLCRRGKAVLLVLHELNLAARFCSQLILVGRGGLLGTGTPDSIMTEENLTRAYGMSIKCVKNSTTNHWDIYTEGANDCE